MGVTKLGDLFEERQTVTFDQFSNKSVAFDGNNILYQFLTRIRQSDGSLLTDDHGNVTSHLSGLLYRVTRILESGIKVVWHEYGVDTLLFKLSLPEPRLN